MSPRSLSELVSKPQRAEQGGQPVRWDRDEIVLLVPPPDSPSPDHEKLVTLVERAARLWHSGDVELTIRVEPSFQKLRSSKDGLSTLRILTARWCPEGKSSDAGCYAKAQVANTTLQSAPFQGREERKLSEGDIVINGVTRVWRLPEDEGALKAIVVHELGHLLGLEHPCSTTGAADRNCAPFADDAMHPVPVRSTFVDDPRPSDSELKVLDELYPVSAAPWFGNIGTATGGLALVLLLGAFFTWRKTRGVMAKK